MNLERNFGIPAVLRERLLEIGGRSFTNEPALIPVRMTPGYKLKTEYLLAHGKEFGGHSNIIRSEIGLCHINAAALYFWSGRKAQIWTGWALAKEIGVWTEHSWNVFDNEVYETIGEWESYFGFAPPDQPERATNELKNAGKWQNDPHNYESQFTPNDDDSELNFYKLRPESGTSR